MILRFLAATYRDVAGGSGWGDDPVSLASMDQSGRPNTKYTLNMRSDLAMMAATTMADWAFLTGSIEKFEFSDAAA